MRNSEAVAEALGLTADELQAARAEGQSLADIAAAQGVSTDTVVDAIVDGIEAHLAEEVAEGDLTQAEADERLATAEERATEKVDAAPGEGGPQGLRGNGGRRSPATGTRRRLTTSSPTHPPPIRPGRRLLSRRPGHLSPNRNPCPTHRPPTRPPSPPSRRKLLALSVPVLLSGTGVIAVATRRPESTDRLTLSLAATGQPDRSNRPTSSPCSPTSAASTARATTSTTRSRRSRHDLPPRGRGQLRRRHRRARRRPGRALPEQPHLQRHATRTSSPRTASPTGASSGASSSTTPSGSASRRRRRPDRSPSTPTTRSRSSPTTSAAIATTRSAAADGHRHRHAAGTGQHRQLLHRRLGRLRRHRRAARLAPRRQPSTATRPTTTPRC